MPKHPPAAYKFTDTKIQQRTQRVIEVGGDIATMFTGIAQRRHAAVGEVVFLKKRLAPLVGSYFKKVQKFKSDNDFALERRITQPKMAALMVEAIIEDENLNGAFFTVPRDLQGKDFEDEAFYEFLYGVIVNTLFIDIDKVPKDHKRDFIKCLHQFSIHTEWLMWALSNFCTAYGELLDAGE